MEGILKMLTATYFMKRISIRVVSISDHLVDAYKKTHLNTLEDSSQQKILMQYIDFFCFKSSNTLLQCLFYDNTCFRTCPELIDSKSYDGTYQMSMPFLSPC